MTGCVVCAAGSTGATEGAGSLDPGDPSFVLAESASPRLFPFCWPSFLVGWTANFACPVVWVVVPLATVLCPPSALAEEAVARVVLVSVRVFV